MSAAKTSAALDLPVITSSTRAITGRPSFKKMFQIPVTSTESAIAEFENPHERYMA